MLEHSVRRRDSANIHLVTEENIRIYILIIKRSKTLKWIRNNLSKCRDPAKRLGSRFSPTEASSSSLPSSKKPLSQI